MNSTKLEKQSSNKCFGGQQDVYLHRSLVCGVPMKFSVFLPWDAASRNLPVLFWLSGLTCTHENFVIKSGFQRLAAESEIIVVCPDTSPRGAEVPGEEDSWDFGTGAGFYVDALQSPFDQNYKMYSYIVDELFNTVHENFSTDRGKVGIFGHSMGGHGALVLGLRNPQKFHSISAFSPICAPTSCPWGIKAFEGYLGSDKSLWLDYDSTQIIQNGIHPTPLLIDQGLEDEFLEEQLGLNQLEEVCRVRDMPLTLRRHPGYDHSYYFIATFLQDHFAWHEKQWKESEA
jgi:S-formylglutathione hydrolase